MKKLILAFIALAFAFAFSSCCDQSYCPVNQKCMKKIEREEATRPERETRWNRSSQERSTRRW